MVASAVFAVGRTRNRFASQSHAVGGDVALPVNGKFAMDANTRAPRGIPSAETPVTGLLGEAPGLSRVRLAGCKSPEMKALFSGAALRPTNGLGGRRDFRLTPRSP